MISIVIPVFNEELIISELYQRTMAAMEAIGEEFEIICVDDGSRDSTLEKLVSYHEKDPRFKVLSLSRNFGHQPAVLAGLTYSRGDYIGVMDGDLQDPPEVFKRFYAKCLEGYDVVYAVRKKRKEGVFKKMAYWTYYRILQGMTNTKLPLDSGDFSFFTRKVLDEMLKMPEHSLFIRGIRFWVGFRQTGMEYERDARTTGEPKYSFLKLLRLAYNGIFSFSDVPIKFLGRIGALTILASLLYALYILFVRLFYGDIPQGFTTLILAIMFFGGVQLVGLRVLGEYLHRIYDETRNRPFFIIEKSYLD